MIYLTKSIFFTTLFLCASLANACSFDGNYIYANFDKEMSESHVVFKGRIIEVPKADLKEFSDEVIVTAGKRKTTILSGALEVEPIEYFKGLPRTDFKIEYSDFCNASSLEVGDERIFFVQKDSNTGLIEPVSQKLLKLIGEHNEKET